MNKFLNTESEISKWLDSHGVTNYSLVCDLQYKYVVNVDGDVNLYKKELACIPIKFNHIEGSFDCSDNLLKNLLGCPKTVTINFHCWGNHLTTLMGSPLSVGKNFDCSNNQLINLEFSPQEIGGCLYCNDNQLTSLKGSPQIITLGFFCNNNQLSSLEYFPQYIGQTFWCNGNPLLKNFYTIRDFKKIQSILLSEKLELNLEDNKYNIIKSTKI